MIYSNPSASDIINASATATTAGIITVPGGRWLTANMHISASITGLGPATPRLIYTVPGGTSGAGPANGSILARLNMASTIGVAAQDAVASEILVYGGDNGCTIDFNSGGATSSSCVINGFLI